MSVRALSRLLPVILGAIIAGRAVAQGPPQSASELPSQQLSLVDLSAFRGPSANWTLAGGVLAERTAPALVTTPGTGVLVNTPAAGKNGHLLTAWEHGDLELSFDVMLPKGSNSGVYLMGRYELQLFDSWGVRAPTFADFGGIYQRWDDARGAGRAGFEGTAPRQNAARAPGLWQHVELLFRAPRFNGTQKVANARFAKVTVNGVVVHENVEVTGPTQAAAFQDERATGPLMIQGDHGPVALRNIRYKSYTGTVTLSSLRYRLYDGDGMDSTRVPVREGDASVITSDLAGAQDNFALKFAGTMRVPTTGTYRFQLALAWIGNDSATRGARVGGGTLAIDAKPVLMHAGAERRVVGEMSLTAGTHPFALTYYKNRPSFNRRDVVLLVEGPGVERQALHEESGINAGGGGPINPIVVEVQQEPVLVRGFVRYRDTKRVIVMSVADPLGVHYSYDLAQGSLLHVWRGPFLETTQMWHERGESQTAEPLGSVVTLAGTPSIAVLADANATWPDSVVDERQLHRDGFQLDKAGRPTFLYRVGGVAVEDRIVPDDGGSSLRRELRLRATSAPAGLYVQLAEADHITQERDGSFVVGDRSYYVVPSGAGPRPVIRRVGENDELVVLVKFEGGVGFVSYTLVW